MNKANRLREVAVWPRAVPYFVRLALGLGRLMPVKGLERRLRASSRKHGAET